MGLWFLADVKQRGVVRKADGRICDIADLFFNYKGNGFPHMWFGTLTLFQINNNCKIKITMSAG
jgi:hypothetical protein